MCAISFYINLEVADWAGCETVKVIALVMSPDGSNLLKAVSKALTAVIDLNLLTMEVLHRVPNQNGTLEKMVLDLARHKLEEYYPECVTIEVPGNHSS